MVRIRTKKCDFLRQLMSFTGIRVMLFLLSFHRFPYQISQSKKLTILRLARRKSSENFYWNLSKYVTIVDLLASFGFIFYPAVFSFPFSSTRTSVEILDERGETCLNYLFRPGKVEPTLSNFYRFLLTSSSIINFTYNLFLLFFPSLPCLKSKPRYDDVIK